MNACVAAAAGLTFALGEIAAAYEQESGTRVRLSFGASGNFARQDTPYEQYLSGGQQQRGALEPRALLPDEPFSAVDRVTRRKLLRQLIQLRRTLVIPGILVTHDFEAARLLADRMTVLHHGRILQSGTPDEILSRPVSALVARLTDQPNLLLGKVLQHAPETGTTRIDWFGWRLPANQQPQFAVGETICWLVSEAVVVLVSEHQESRANALLTQVAKRLSWRDYTTVIAQVESRRDTAWSFAINAGLAQQQGIAPGAEVLLSIQKAAGCLLPAEQVTPPALAARSP